MSLSWLFGSVKSDVVDPTTGLSQRDRANITDTWSIFRQDVRVNAIGLFEALFVKHPEYQKLFLGFEDTPPTELQRNHCAVAHALAVVYFFTAMVDNIDDKEILTELIKKNVRGHLRRPVLPEHFVNMGVVIVDQLRAKIKFRMTTSVVTSWQRFFVLHDTVTRQYFKELSLAIPEPKRP